MKPEWNIPRKQKRICVTKIKGRCLLVSSALNCHTVWTAIIFDKEYLFWEIYTGGLNTKYSYIHIIKNKLDVILYNMFKLHHYISNLNLFALRNQIVPDLNSRHPLIKCQHTIFLIFGKVWLISNIKCEIWFYVTPSITTNFDNKETYWSLYRNNVSYMYHIFFFFT